MKQRTSTRSFASPRAGGGLAVGRMTSYSSNEFGTKSKAISTDSRMTGGRMRIHKSLFKTVVSLSGSLLIAGTHDNMNIGFVLATTPTPGFDMVSGLPAGVPGYDIPGNDLWPFIPAEVDAFNRPTSLYHFLRGMPETETQPSKCGNGPTILDNIHLIHSATLQAACPGIIAQTQSVVIGAVNATMVKNGLDYSNPGDKALWDSELAKVDLSKWSCGISDECREDATCCRFVKAWPLASNSKLAAELGIKHNEMWANGVAHMQAAGFTLMRKFADAGKTHFYSPMAGHLGFSHTDLDAPKVSQVPALAPVYAEIQAKAKAMVPQPPGVPETGSYPAGLTAAQIAQFDAINAQVAGGRAMAIGQMDTMMLGGIAKFAASEKMLALGLKPYNFTIKSPWTNMNEKQGENYSRDGALPGSYPKNVNFRFNRCIDLCPYQPYGANFTGPNWPSCTDGNGFIFRGRNLTATPESIARNNLVGQDRINERGEEWSLGNDQGNIFNKTEIFFLVGGGMGIDAARLNTQWIGGSAMELAIAEVNNPDQTSFPNLKNYHLGMVFMDDHGGERHLAASALQRTLMRIPQRTIALVGETDEEACHGQSGVAYEANMMVVAGSCSNQAFTDKTMYPNMAISHTPIGPSAMSVYQLLIDMNYERIALVNDPNSQYSGGLLQMKAAMDIALKAYQSGKTLAEGAWNWDVMLYDFQKMETTPGGFTYISDVEHVRMIKKLKKLDYRIIVFSGPLLAALDFFCGAVVEKFWGRQVYFLFSSKLSATSLATHNTQRSATYGDSPCTQAQMYDFFKRGTVVGQGPAVWVQDTKPHPFAPHKTLNDFRMDYKARHPECHGSSYDNQVIGIGRWEACWGTFAAPVFDATMATIKALDLAIGAKNFTADDFLNEPITGKVLNPEIANTMADIMATGGIDHEGVTAKFGYDDKLSRKWGLEIFQFNDDQKLLDLTMMRPPISMVVTLNTERYARAVSNGNDPTSSTYVGVSPILFYDQVKSFMLGKAWNATGQWRPSDKIPKCPWGSKNVPIYGTDQESCQECPEGQGPHKFGYPESQLGGAPMNCEPCGIGYYSNKNDTIHPVTGVMECMKAPVGHFVNATGATKPTPCAAGYYQGESGAYECLKCQTGTFMPQLGQSRCTACARGTYQDEQGQAECKTCAAGEGTIGQGSVYESECLCPETFFAACLGGDGIWPSNYADLKKQCDASVKARCVECPKGMKCSGFSMAVGPDLMVRSNNTMCGKGEILPKDANGEDYACVHAPPIPTKGFWSGKDAIYNSYDCFYSARCPGGMFEHCATQFTGFACATCPVGNSVQNTEDNEMKGACLECDSEPHKYVIAPFLCLFGGLATYNVYYFSVKNRQAMGRMAVAATMGLMVQTLQYLTVFDRFSIAWGSPIGEALAALQFIAFDLNVVGGSCVFGNSAVPNTLVRFALPLYLFCNMLVFSKASAVYDQSSLADKFGRRFSISPWREDSFVNAAGLGWLVFFISLCMMILSMFQCYEHPAPGLDKDGERVLSLRVSPDVRCFEGEHWPLLALGLTGLACYIIIPFVQVVRITKRAQADPKNNLNRVRHYFLIARYGVKHMHWTYFVLFRNLTLAFIPVIFSSAASHQLLVFSAYTLAWCIFIGNAKPWLSPALNVLDCCILAAVALLSAWGFVYVVEEEGKNAEKVVMMGTLVIMGCCFGMIFFVLVCFFAGEFLNLYHPTLLMWGLQSMDKKKAEVVAAQTVATGRRASSELSAAAAKFAVLAAERQSTYVPGGVEQEEDVADEKDQSSDEDLVTGVVDVVTADGTLASISLREVSASLKVTAGGVIKEKNDLEKFNDAFLRDSGNDVDYKDRFGDRSRNFDTYGKRNSSTDKYETSVAEAQKRDKRGSNASVSSSVEV